MPLDSHISYTFLLPGILLLVVGLMQALRKRQHAPTLLRGLCIADAGWFCVGLGCGGAAGDGGAVAQLLFTGLARVLAWYCLLRLTSSAGSGELTTLRGIGRAKPVTATLFAFAMFAALGISPFLSPDAKPLMLFAALAGNLWITAALLTAASACMTVLTVCAVHEIWLKGGAFAEQKERFSDCMPQLILAGVLALMGVFGHSVVGLSGWDAAQFPDMAVSWPLAALIPYLGAFVAWGVGRSNPRLRNLIAIICMGAALVAALLLPAAPLGRLFAVLITGMGLLVALYSSAYIHGRNENSYYFFLLLTFGSLAGIALQTNLGGLYVLWEVMTLASYVLVAHEDTDIAHAAAIKYYVMCAVGAAVMLPGLLLLGVNAGGLGMEAIAGAGASLAPGATVLAGLLVLVGFGVKAGLFPGHGWLPDAHPAAPSSVSAPLSGILTKIGIFGVAQVFLVLLGAGALLGQNVGGVPALGMLFTILGLCTMVYGEVMALRQDDIKRLLAYSTMGQIGEITMTLGLCGYIATTGALLHVVNHAVMKDLLFLCSGALILRAGSRKLYDLRGLGRAMPFTAGCMVVGLISILGLPPFAGFMSKYLMLSALAEVSPVLAGMLLLGSLAGCVYYMRIVRTLIFEPYEGPQVEEAPLAMRVPLGILTALCLLMGLFPGLGLSLVTPVADALVAQGKIAVQTLPGLSPEWQSYTLVIMLGAALPFIYRKLPEQAGRMTAGVLAVAALMVLVFGGNLDPLSYMFAFIVPAVGCVNMSYATGYMNHSHTQWRFYVFFLFMCAGLTGVAASTNLFSFFFYWEIMSSWSLYFVIVHEENAAALREGFKYFFFNVLGAAFLFLGVVLLVHWCGGSGFAAVRENLPTLSAGQIGTALFLMATGFVMKAAQLPFRIDVQMHPATAPTPVSGYISSVLLKSALFGLAKLFLSLGGGVAIAGAAGWFGRTEIMHIVVWVGGITIVMAAAFAVFQSDIKLVLIYSTVSQLGYMVVGVALGTSLGVAGGLLHLVNHVFFKDLLFLVAGALIVQTHRQSMNDMGGVGKKMPITLAFFAIGALSVIGVPPSNGFTSKWIIYHALMEQGHVIPAILSLVGSVLTLAYFAKMLHIAFLGQTTPEMEKVTEAPRSMLLPMGVLAAGCLVTGVFPGLILGPLNHVLTQFSLPVLDVAPWGLVSGRGAWNATATALYFGVTWFGARYVLRTFSTKRRTTSIHTCGIPPEEFNSRTTARDIYSAPAGLRRRLGADTPR